MKSRIGAVVAALLFLLVLRVLTQVNWRTLLAALGLWGNGKSITVKGAAPGRSFWATLGGALLVLLLGAVFPPLAWAVLLGAFLYLLFADNLIGKLAAGARTLTPPPPTGKGGAASNGG